MISLYDLLKASRGQLFGEAAAHLFEDFCINADDARPNQLFVAQKSEQRDTHPHISRAIANGVAGVVCMQPPTCDTDGVSVVLVEDTVQALLAWTHYVLGKFGTKVIGVTGTTGKSVAVDAISRILGLRYPVYVNLNKENNRLSVPLTLGRLNPTHKFAVLKLGVSQPGEIAAMVEAIQPEVGVVTHISSVHDDQFSTLDQTAQEKRLLMEYLSPGGLAVLNYDDERVRQLASHTRAKVKTVAMQTFGADMMAYNTSCHLDRTAFDLRYKNERFTQQAMPLLGDYHLYPVMAALCVGVHFDVPLAEALEVLANLRPLPSRMNPLQGENGSVLIDDTYSANLQSTLAALHWMASVRDERGRAFFVFGDMDAAGDDGGKGHVEVGMRAAQVNDVIVTQGNQAALAAQAALNNGMERKQVHVTYTPQDTVEVLRSHDLKPGDLVLLKGGSHVQMERVTHALLEDPSAQSDQLVRQNRLAGDQVLSHAGRLSWVEINANALANNVRLTKAMLGEQVKLMAVVKADAYGHGAVVAAQTALLNGAEYLGVSSLQEALELRNAGIDAPILTMNYVPSPVVRHAIHHDLTLTLFDVQLAQSYNRIAGEMGTKARVHIKIDSGMGRMGFLANEFTSTFRYLMAMQNLEIDGIYTHFSKADEDDAYTQKQLVSFKTMLRSIQSTTGFDFNLIHAANSAGAFAYPETHLDMVRMGVALYGLHPSERVPLSEEFVPVMTWKTLIAQVKELPAGHSVGYGGTYVTKERERVALLPVGYGDGFRRSPNNWGEVLVRGQRAPVIGRVSMEKTMISVQHIPDVSIGDEVVLLGKQGDAVITAEEIANRLGTINYEVTCTVLPRVPRY